MSLSGISFSRTKFLRRISRKNRNFSNTEWILWLVPIGLVLLSGLLIASTQRQAEYQYWHFHWTTGLVGIFIALLLSHFPLERLRSFLAPIYLFVVGSLLWVSFFGSSALGAQRWITILGFNVQPSEVAKINLILILASLLDQKRFYRLSHLLNKFN